MLALFNVLTIWLPARLSARPVGGLSARGQGARKGHTLSTLYACSPLQPVTPGEMPPPPTNEELASFAGELADAARGVILPYWRQPIDVQSKMEDHRPIAESPVTIADQRAEEAMRAMIEERYPGHGIYGEEYGQIRTDAEYVW